MKNPIYRILFYFDLNRSHQANLKEKERIDQLSSEDLSEEFYELLTDKSKEKSDKEEKVEMEPAKSPKPVLTPSLPAESKNMVVTKKLTIFEQFIMYLGIALGVLFSNFLIAFKEGQTVILKFEVISIFIALIIALVLIPFVYEKLRIDPNTPLLVRFGLFVQHGVFWQVIFGSIGKHI